MNSLADSVKEEVHLPGLNTVEEIHWGKRQNPQKTVCATCQPKTGSKVQKPKKNRPYQVVQRPKSHINAVRRIPFRSKLIPGSNVVNRYCLTKRQHIKLLAWPKQIEYDPHCFKPVVVEQQPCSPRVAQLSIPAKFRIIDTLKLHAGHLPMRKIEHLNETIKEGLACLNIQQARHYFDTMKKLRRSRKPVRKRKGLEKQKCQCLEKQWLENTIFIISYRLAKYLCCFRAKHLDINGRFLASKILQVLLNNFHFTDFPNVTPTQSFGFKTILYNAADFVMNALAVVEICRPPTMEISTSTTSMSSETMTKKSLKKVPEKTISELTLETSLEIESEWGEEFGEESLETSTEEEEESDEEEGSEEGEGEEESGESGTEGEGGKRKKRKHKGKKKKGEKGDKAKKTRENKKTGDKERTKKGKNTKSEKEKKEKETIEKEKKKKKKKKGTGDESDEESEGPQGKKKAKKKTAKGKKDKEEREEKEIKQKGSLRKEKKKAKGKRKKKDGVGDETEDEEIDEVLSEEQEGEEVDDLLTEEGGSVRSKKSEKGKAKKGKKGTDDEALLSEDELYDEMSTKQLVEILRTYYSIMGSDPELKVFSKATLPEVTLLKLIDRIEGILGLHPHEDQLTKLEKAYYEKIVKYVVSTSPSSLDDEMHKVICLISQKLARESLGIHEEHGARSEIDDRSTVTEFQEKFIDKTSLEPKEDEEGGVGGKQAKKKPRGQRARTIKGDVADGEDVETVENMETGGEVEEIEDVNLTEDGKKRKKQARKKGKSEAGIEGESEEVAAEGEIENVEEEGETGVKTEDIAGEPEEKGESGVDEKSSELGEEPEGGKRPLGEDLSKETMEIVGGKRLKASKGKEDEKKSIDTSKLDKTHDLQLFPHNPNVVCCTALKFWAEFIEQVTDNAKDWCAWINQTLHKLSYISSIVRGDAMDEDGCPIKFDMNKWRCFLKKLNADIIHWRHYNQHVDQLIQQIIANYNGKQVECCQLCDKSGDIDRRTMMNTDHVCIELIQGLKTMECWRQWLNTMVAETSAVSLYFTEKNITKLSDGPSKSEIMEMTDSKSSDLTGMMSFYSLELIETICEERLKQIIPT